MFGEGILNQYDPETGWSGTDEPGEYTMGRYPQHINDPWQNQWNRENLPRETRQPTHLQRFIRGMNPESQWNDPQYDELDWGEGSKSSSILNQAQDKFGGGEGGY